MDKREFISKRIAQEFKDGDVVNLGIGMPTMVANYVSKDINITLQSENGILGLGPNPKQEELDKDVTDSGGKPITVTAGASFFDSAYSFALIRGGHVDITVLGALEVDEDGNLANWMVPGKKVPGMGGAMDLVVGAKRVILAMEHMNKNGESKVVKRCKLPLTASKEVNTIITDMAVIEVIQGKGLLLKEIAPGLNVEDVRNATEAELIISSDLKVMEV